jgi:hypothetical protein
MCWSFLVYASGAGCTAEREREYRGRDDTQQKMKRIISARNTIAPTRGTPIAGNTNRAKKGKDFAD